MQKTTRTAGEARVNARGGQLADANNNAVEIHKDLSRRKFVACTAAGLIGAATMSMSGCASDNASVKADADKAVASAPSAYFDARFSFRSDWLGEPELVDASEINRTLDAEIAVVGCGHAGSALVRRAAELGVKVVAIEAQSEKDFEANGSDIGHLNSQWQRSLGIPEFDPIEYMNVFQTLSCGRAQPGLLRRYANRSGEMFDWLLEVLSPEQIAAIKVCDWPVEEGYQYQRGWMRAYPGTPKLNTDAINTTVLLRAQHARALDLGAEILYGAVGRYLVKNETGRVIGFVAQDASGAHVQVNASRAVVIAAGDFASNPDMFTSLIQEAAELNPGTQLVGMGRDGSGIKMGLWAGAKMDAGPRAAMGANTVTPASPLSGAPLWLNSEGMRYCNEGFGHPFVAGVQGARQPFGSLYAIFDANWRAMLKSQLTGHGDPMYWDDVYCDGIEASLVDAIAAGPAGTIVETPMASYGVFAASSLEELAAYLELDEATFVSSVSRYNEMCAAGRDEDYAKDPSLLFPLDNPPFFASVSPHAAGGRVLVTLAGLFVDEFHNCMDDDFKTIPGLYAVGNSSGGRFPLQYSAPNHGASLGMANTLGYVLAEELAQS